MCVSWCLWRVCWCCNKTIQNHQKRLPQSNVKSVRSRGDVLYLCSQRKGFRKEKMNWTSECTASAIVEVLISMMDILLESSVCWELLGFTWPHFCQIAGQTYKESFKIYLESERDGVLSIRWFRSCWCIRNHRKTPVKRLRGVTACSSKKVTLSIAWLKRLHTNAHTMYDRRSWKSLCSQKAMI